MANTFPADPKGVPEAMRQLDEMLTGARADSVIIQRRLTIPLHLAEIDDKHVNRVIEAAARLAETARDCVISEGWFTEQ